MTRIAPVTPGELLFEEFLKPLGITQYRLAKEIGVSAQHIGDFVAGRRADTDWRLCRIPWLLAASGGGARYRGDRSVSGLSFVLEMGGKVFERCF